jgi:hypothetical protein
MAFSKPGSRNDVPSNLEVFLLALVQNRFKEAIRYAEQRQ